MQERKILASHGTPKIVLSKNHRPHIHFFSRSKTAVTVTLQRTLPGTITISWYFSVRFVSTLLFFPYILLKS